MIEKCRSCGSVELEKVMDLGSLKVINFGDKDPVQGDLVLMLCKACTLLQLRDSVDQDYLFRNYYYKSGVNASMRAELQDIVKSAMARVDLKEGDVVVDIGTNDGTLLSFYPKQVYKLGFEPAMNLKGESAGPGIAIMPDFFYASKLAPGGMMSCKSVFGEKASDKAKVITAIAMFYDLADPNAFLEDIKQVLAEDGLFVIQQNYLPAMLENNAFDNVVHEHLEYYSVKSLEKLLEKHNLVIEDVEFNDVNGGSFRVYIRQAAGPYESGDSVADALDREDRLGLDKPQVYKEFAAKVDLIRRKIHNFVSSQVSSGKTVYIAGASTRGNTLVQVCQLQDLIEYAVERNPAKWGKTYCGKIKVISEKTAEEIPPDYYLVLPWHFKGEMIDRMMGQLLRGSKLLFPLPKPHVVEARNL